MMAGLNPLWAAWILGRPGHPSSAAIGRNMVSIILIAIVGLLVASVLVLLGYQNQKGPRGRGGPLGPRS